MVLLGFIVRIYRDANSCVCQFICNTAVTSLPPIEFFKFHAKHKSYTNCPLYRVPEHGVCNFAVFICHKLSVFGDTIKEPFCLYWKVKESLYNPGPFLKLPGV